MKLIQVTDLHLGPQRQSRLGSNPHERLAACIAHINRSNSDAELCILTGDLADRGELAAYEDLRSLLQALSVPYTLLLGNHDRRAAFGMAFPDAAVSPGGFVQSVRDVQEPGRLVVHEQDFMTGWARYDLGTGQLLDSPA